VSRVENADDTWILARIRPGCCGAAVAAGLGVVSQSALEPLSIRQDGFGVRVVEQTAKFGRLERLTLSPALATAGSEQAIRARAAHLNSLGSGPVGRILKIERKGGMLSVLGELPEGVSLSDILAALEFGTLTLSDDELLELVASVVRAAGQMHEMLRSVAHGALSPAHVVVRREGATVFTGAVFGDALQALKRSRENLWREFGIVLPAAASAPRIDRRGDVAQLGALVLGIALRRSLRRDEFPQGLGDLVSSVSIGPNQQLNLRLRTWLQDTLQLQGRVVFDSCVEAARKLTRLLPKGCGDEAGALALRTAILQLCGEGSVASRT